MNINRKWCMPDKNTFSMKPVKEFIESHIFPLNNKIIIDPFSRNSIFSKYSITNDLSPEHSADYHLEALDFLKMFEDGSVDVVLFDPPYSPRQISECYKGVGRDVHMSDTQSSFYSIRKKEVGRVLKSGGKAICFGWNSGGIGKSLGFDMVDILLLAHGGAHNDTICTVEIKKEV